MISIRPAETIKSEQLQNKEFKLTSCQPLLVFFLGGGVFCLFFHLNCAEYMMFYLTDIQSKSTNIPMPSQREENGGDPSTYILAGSISDKRGSLF